MKPSVAAAVPDAPAPPPACSLPEVPTPDELAKFLRRSRSSVYAALRSGEIPARRLGKGYVLHRDAILDWLAGRASEGAPEQKRGRR